MTDSFNALMDQFQSPHALTIINLTPGRLVQPVPHVQGRSTGSSSERSFTSPSDHRHVDRRSSTECSVNNTSVNVLEITEKYQFQVIMHSAAGA